MQVVLHTMQGMWHSQNITETHLYPNLSKAYSFYMYLFYPTQGLLEQQGLKFMCTYSE